MDFNDSNEFYGYHQFGRTLGKGSFGLVVECKRKHDSKLCVIKFIKKNSIYKWLSLGNVDHCEKLLPIEVACLQQVSHLPNIIRILDYVPPTNEVQLNLDDDEFKQSSEEIIGIVFERNKNEKCFFHYLMEKNLLNETESRCIFRQLIEVNLALLKLGILHGDLKSENILIDEQTKQIKLIDFGSAQFIDNSGKIQAKAMHFFMGTNVYKPPEYIMYKCFYPRPSTVWCLGIILHDMVCGYFPFRSEEDILIHKDNDLIFYKQDLSVECKDLIKRCLAFYAADRISIDNLLCNSWFLS